MNLYESAQHLKLVETLNTDVSKHIFHILLESENAVLTSEFAEKMQMSPLDVTMHLIDLENVHALASDTHIVASEFDLDARQWYVAPDAPTFVQDMLSAFDR
jgi:hypothetical protein